MSDRDKTIYKSHKIVHTGLYGDKALAIVTLASEFMCTMRGDAGHVFGYSSVERECNGEVVVNFKYDSELYPNSVPWALRGSELLLKPDAVILTKMADHLKKEIREAYVDWKRDSVTPYKPHVRRMYGEIVERTFNFTIGDVYSVYDCLKGRRRQISKLDQTKSDSIVGHALDPVATEIEAVKREEIAKIERQYVADKNALICAAEAEIDAVHAEIDKLREKLNEKLYAIRDRRDDGIKQLGCKKDADIRKLCDEIAALSGGGAAPSASVAV